MWWKSAVNLSFFLSLATFRMRSSCPRPSLHRLHRVRLRCSWVHSGLFRFVRRLRCYYGGVRLAAINQCSGNSRGFFWPRVAGAQWAHGVMGNANWTGVRLKDVLHRAGVRAGATQVRFKGLDPGRAERAHFHEAA